MKRVKREKDPYNLFATPESSFFMRTLKRTLDQFRADMMRKLQEESSENTTVVATVRPPFDAEYVLHICFEKKREMLSLVI